MSKSKSHPLVHLVEGNFVFPHALRTEGKQNFLQQDELMGETYSYSYSYETEPTTMEFSMEDMISTGAVEAGDEGSYTAPDGTTYYFYSSEEVATGAGEGAGEGEALAGEGEALAGETYSYSYSYGSEGAEGADAAVSETLEAEVGLSLEDLGIDLGDLGLSGESYSYSYSYGMDGAAGAGEAGADGAAGFVAEGDMLAGETYTYSYGYSMDGAAGAGEGAADGAGETTTTTYEFDGDLAALDEGMSLEDLGIDLADFGIGDGESYTYSYSYGTDGAAGASGDAGFVAEGDMLAGETYTYSCGYST